MGNGVAFTTEVGRGVTTFQALPEEILIDPELNGRHENTDVSSLAADIEANEQLTPVVCRKDENGRPVLVFGHRRYRAFCLLNERNPGSPRKINFIYRKYEPFGAFIAAIGENRFRKDVSPIDDASNMEILQRKFGKTDDEITSIYFPEAKSVEDLTAAKKWVKDRMALSELAPEAAQAVRDGRVKITAAVALSKLTQAQQKKKVAEPGKVKVADVKSTSIPKAPQVIPRVNPELLGLINTVIETADPDELDGNNVWVSVHRQELIDLREYVTNI